MVGECLAGLRNVKGNTMAAVETSWKAVGDEVREASGSPQGCEPGQEMANFHGNGSSGLQPEREVSGVGRKKRRQKPEMKVVWTRAGAGNRDGVRGRLKHWLCHKGRNEWIS